ncbi:MAG TPA: TolC family protein [Polyangiaceae bacterium]
MNRRSLVLGRSVALLALGSAPSAFAQNAPSVQGMPPVSSPNAPATQQALPAPQPVNTPTRTTPLYTPPPVPQGTILQAPATAPGGTSVRQLGQAGPAGQNETAVPAPTLEKRLLSLIGRPSGLTAEQAAARARATSYDVKAKKAEYEAAQSTVNQATLAYVPRIKGTASYTRTSPVSLSAFGISIVYPEDNWNLQVDVDVPLSDYALKIAKLHAGAEHSAKAAEFTARAADAMSASNAQISYYSWARARLNAVVAEAALENAQQHLADAKAEFAAGKASQADVLAVQAQLAQNTLLVTRAHNSVTLEEDRVHTAMHDPGTGSYEIGEPLLTDLPPVSGQEDLNGLISESLKTRPEFLSITETARGLHLQAQASKFDVLPKLDGIGTAQYANPNPRYFPPGNAWNGTWAVGAAVTWAATDVVLGATNGATTEARAQSTEAQALSMREGIRDEVLQAWQAVHESEAAIQSTEESLNSAEESYRVRRALFRADRATSTELSQSENALTQARFEVVGARIDLRIARVRLAHATGRDAKKD